jgi:hypothetical protein
MAKKAKDDEQKHARYLADPDTGKSKLIAADDLDAKYAAGWTEPTGQKANGEQWNVDDDEDAVQARDVAADQAKVNDEYASKKAEKKAQELADAQAAADEARASEPVVPDMKVQIVNPPSDENKD